MSKVTKWHVKAAYMVFALALVVSLSGAFVVVASPAPTAGAAGEEQINTLRIYGRSGENAAFPYTDYQGPLSLTSSEAPLKDFVVFNPAIMLHQDLNSLGEFSDYFVTAIRADGDASEKVHLRMWYVPKLLEPVGRTFTGEGDVPLQDKVSNWDRNGMGDIVLEYTYMLLDPVTLNPTHGSGNATRIVFPMAGYGGQKGLDRMDVNGDGIPETLSIDEIEPLDGGGTNGTIKVSAMPAGTPMRIGLGGNISFLDYQVTVKSLNAVAGTVQVQLSYIGNLPPKESIGVTQTLTFGGTDSVVAGRYWTPAVSGPLNEAAARAAAEAAMKSYSPWLPARPFWVSLDGIGMDGSTPYCVLTPHRILMTGETFFVECVEYDVAAIYVVDLDADAEETEMEFKYITLRNPLPKKETGGADTIAVPSTIWKCRIAANESLWTLPPFSYTHDMVDDINIDEYNNSYLPDAQNRDNYVSQIYGSYDLISERIVDDVGSIDGDLPIYWIEEAKEDRFDTNLLEEKFVEDDVEYWQWKNIETMPWDYTEFVLPALPDITIPGAGYEAPDGDYIVVSSFITEDSTDVWPNTGAVRVKFVYDKNFEAIDEDKTGIYVNTIDLCDAWPTAVAADKSGVVGGTVVLSGSASGGEGTYSYAWNFDDDGLYDDSAVQNPTVTVNDWWTVGANTIGLRVTDGDGCKDTDTAIVTISDECGTYTFLSATQELMVYPGADCAFPGALTNVGPGSGACDTGHASPADCVTIVWGMVDHDSNPATPQLWKSFNPAQCAGELGDFGMEEGEAYVIVHDGCYDIDWEMCCP